jgi:hypothetical protein
MTNAVARAAHEAATDMLYDMRSTDWTERLAAIREAKEAVWDMLDGLEQDLYEEAAAERRLHPSLTAAERNQR